MSGTNEGHRIGVRRACARIADINRLRGGHTARKTASDDDFPARIEGECRCASSRCLQIIRYRTPLQTHWDLRDSEREPLGGSQHFTCVVTPADDQQPGVIAGHRDHHVLGPFSALQSRPLGPRIRRFIENLGRVHGRLKCSPIATHDDDAIFGNRNGHDG